MKYTDTKNRLFEHFSLEMAVFILRGSKSNKKNNDLDEYNLSGKVKSVISFTYSPEEHYGNIEIGEIKRRYNYEEVTFNRNGNKIEEKPHHKNNKPTEKELHKHTGKRSEKTSTSKTKLTHKYENKYDDNGNVIEEIIYNTDGNLIAKGLLKYNYRQDVIEAVKYDSGGKPQKKLQFKYDNDGNLIEGIEYDPYGKCIMKLRFKYDENGKIINFSQYDSFEILSFKNIFKYDKKGNLFELKSDLYGEGKINSKIQYKYDNEGNWIKLIKFDQGEIINIKERKIEYFD